MKVGDVLQNGQVPPEEPPVGSAVTDREGDIWRHDADKVWLCPSADMWREWAAIVNRWGPLTVTELPEPQTLALEDVREGMRVRVTQTWPDGTRTIEGLVTRVDRVWISFGGRSQNCAPPNVVTEIVLLEPAPMVEPEPGTLVQHAGRTFARSRFIPANRDVTQHWLLLRGEGITARGGWLTWEQVLALDLARTPEIVEV